MYLNFYFLEIYILKRSFCDYSMDLTKLLFNMNNKIITIVLFFKKEGFKCPVK